MERDRPLYGVALLHQCRLVHGPDPTAHVLLCVRAEEIRAHPAVLRLRANHRVPVVNVGAHSRMGRLSKREEEIRGDKTTDRDENWRPGGRETQLPETPRRRQTLQSGNFSSQQHLLEGGGRTIKGT